MSKIPMTKAGESSLRDELQRLNKLSVRVLLPQLPKRVNMEI